MFIDSSKRPFNNTSADTENIHTVRLYYNGKFKSANREGMCQMDLLSQYKINKCFRAYVERKYIGFISAALKTIKPAPQKKQSSANNSYRIKPNQCQKETHHVLIC